jgi:hypothetical protein
MGQCQTHDSHESMPMWRGAVLVGARVQVTCRRGKRGATSSAFASCMILAIRNCNGYIQFGGNTLHTSRSLKATGISSLGAYLPATGCRLKVVVAVAVCCQPLSAHPAILPFAMQSSQKRMFCMNVLTPASQCSANVYHASMHAWHAPKPLILHMSAEFCEHFVKHTHKK